MGKFNRLLNSLSRNIDEHGVRGVFKTIDTAQQFSRRELRYVVRNKWQSTNVYSRDWDVLILLDCATIEMMNEVKEDYEFIGDVEEHISPGTCSNEWMMRTFTDKYSEQMSDTLHVTANTSSDTYLNSDDFLHLEEVWKDGWNKEMGTIPAREVTDRAIYFGRKYDPERMIIHYMQPHLPFVESGIESNIITPHGVKGEGLMLGELYEEGYTKEELWRASVNNLHYVLEDLELLLSNLDADKAVLSSDHGQAFGENGVWAHPCFTYIDVLRKVPWCVTSGSDTSEYQPEYEPKEVEPEIGLDEKLEALGYK